MSHKDPIPPELVEQINEGNCVLFVGAALSGAAGLPDSRRLGKMLADAADYPRHDEALPRIAEAYEQVKGRHELISFLVREISDQEVAPAEGHRIIARLAAQGAFSHIFTTNLDTLLERALRQQGCPYNVVKRDADASFGGKGIVQLVKLYGGIDDAETLAITQEDLQGFFEERPLLSRVLEALLAERTFLIIGQDLEDPTFEQIYDAISDSLGDLQRRSYAVQLKADGFTERQWQRFHVDLWRKRNVEVVSMDPTAFLRALEAVVGEEREVEDVVGALPSALVPAVPTVKDFVGRDPELTLLCEAIADPDVTIVAVEGIGGIGKTELAARLAQDISEPYRVLWVDCTAEMTLETFFVVLARFATACGHDALARVARAPTVHIKGKIEECIAALDETAYAIFLDDFHLVDDRYLDRFLVEAERRVRRVKFVLVGRQRPRVLAEVRPQGAAEVVLEAGLDQEAAFKFLRNIGLREDPDVLHRVWACTEGHPKAMQIFCALTRYHSVEALLSNLPKYEDVLAEHWMEALFNELNRPEQALVLTASVFKRPVRRQAYAYVYLEDDVDDVINRLVDRCILEPSNRGKLNMAGMFRDYGYRRLQDKSMAHRRAASYYLRNYTLEHGRAAMEEAEVEDKLRAHYHLLAAGDAQGATDVVHDIRWQLWAWGRYKQLMLLVESTLRILPKPDPELLIYKSRVHLMWGQTEKSLPILTQLAEDQGLDIETRLRASHDLALIYRDKGDYDRALELMQRCYEQDRQQGDQWNIAVDLHQMAIIYQRMKQYEKAWSLYVESLALREAVGDEWGVAKTKHQLGKIHLDRDEYDEALTLFQESLAIKEKLGTNRDAALSRGEIAYIYERQGRLSEAVGLYQDSLRTFEAVGDLPSTARVYCRLALIQEKLGDVARAMEYARHALELCKKIGLQEEYWEAEEALKRLERGLPSDWQ